MRILFWVSGTSDPSPRFRFLQFVEPLRALGHTIDVQVANPPRSYVYSGSLFLRTFDYLKTTLKRIWQALMLIRLAGNYDVVFTNKDIVPNLRITFLERWLSMKNPNLIFDIDDAIYLGPRGKKLHKILPYYKAVIAGSPILQEYVQKAYGVKSYYIPMAIDMSKYKPITSRPPGKIRIGWSGSHHTNTYALPLLKEPLEQLSHESDFEFIVISDKDPNIKWDNVQVRFMQWNAAEEVEQLQWMDIGLMPLKDGDFERGKCALKAVQYMAIAIPPIVSPVGVNRLIVRDGLDGYHFTDKRQLLEKLRLLMSNVDLRLSLGKTSYENVVKNYSVDVLSKEYERVFREISSTI